MGRIRVNNLHRNELSWSDPYSPLYDDDGNMIFDGVNTNEWNGENRLVSTEPISPSIGAKKAEFAYDFMGRRWQKIVSSYDGTNWNQLSTNLFTYDGWNVIAELSACGGNLTTNHYTWGLDLSGSLEGAGGIGGLLSMTQSTNTYLYCFDGNGNVMALVNAADGTVDAEYEYGPFGEVLKADGDAADDNAFRFSTKYEDESGKLYYGYRYYDPDTGRWLSREPLLERAFQLRYGATPQPATRAYVAMQNEPVGNLDRDGALLLQSTPFLVPAAYSGTTRPVIPG